jgi:hypothetical protein
MRGPSRDSTNAERLDGQNGLLVVSPVAHAPSLERMGVPTERVFETGRFTAEQGRFLEYHRYEVFLSARVRNAG